MTNQLKIGLSAHTKISIEVGSASHYERWQFIEDAPVEFPVDVGDRSKPGWFSENRKVSLLDLVLAWCEKHGETLSVGLTSYPFTPTILFESSSDTK